MALRFEQITQVIKKMGETAAEETLRSADLVTLFSEKLRRHARAWSLIEQKLSQTAEGVDRQKYRSARPLRQDEPLDQGIDPLPSAEPATLIATDGSQALTSRHAPFQYYLINIGSIIYQHGRPSVPQEDSRAELFYMGDEAETKEENLLNSFVTIQRDRREIATLAQLAQQYQDHPPVWAILDQRLQYRPIGAQSTDRSAIHHWIEQMSVIQATGANLVGYIERPQTSAIITLLVSLDWGTEHLRPEWLSQAPLSDTQLFRRVLKTGQRSPVFRVINYSTNYRDFLQAQQEICFFYYKPPSGGDLSRIDIPLWVAENPEKIAHLHTLLHHQALLLGGYPYILTRADEIAVVTHKDQQYLDQLIAIEMMRHGVQGHSTGKEQGKRDTRL